MKEAVSQTQQEERYHNAKKNLLEKRKKAIKQLEDARKRFERLDRSLVPRKEVKLRHAENAIALCQNHIALIDGELRFLRPQFDEDVSYRNRQYEEFSDQIKKKLPEDVPLRFHGCPIYAAEKIIASGEISSSVDRIGVETSYDGAGQISVTTRDDLYITVQSYANLNYDYNLPAGCIFVVTPASLADEECGKLLLMGNVNFKDDPQRLVAVISTPENIPFIQSWLADSGLSPAKAVDFDDFEKSVEKFVQSVQLSYRDLPYKANDFAVSGEKPRQLSLDEQIMAASVCVPERHLSNKTPVREPGLDR